MAVRISENVLLVRELNAFTPCRERSTFTRMVELVDRVLLTAKKRFSKGAYIKIIKALFYSADLHKGEYRKDNVTPYMLHLLEACCILEDAGVKSYHATCSAILHDTVELIKESTDEMELKKMKVRLGEIEKQFGVLVRKLVDALTKRPKEGKSGYWRRMLSLRSMLALMYALLVKFADRIHNMRTLHCVKPHDRLRKIAETREWFPELRRKLEETIQKLFVRKKITEKKYLKYPSRLYQMLEAAMLPYA